MKKLFTLTALLFFIGLSAKAQIFTIGPKFGVSNTTLSIKDNVGEYESGDAKYSYHGGIFARIKITGFYIQPEIYFNSVKGEYVDPNRAPDDQNVTFNRNKIDLPILFGWKMGPLRINAGPVASFNLDNEVPNNTNSAVSEYKNSVFAYQAGIGVDISKLIIDLRYEGNLSNQAVLGNNEGNVRVNQIMLSVGYKLL
jgi:opacity protein-like surface antigen